MTSTTPYKDELIRVATILGLPDDADPTDVAEHVRKLAADLASERALRQGVEAMRDYQQRRADKFREGLEDAADVIERAQADLRGITGAQLLQSRATAQRLVGDLGLAHAAAETALEEPPEPPEVEEV